MSINQDGIALKGILTLISVYISFSEERSFLKSKRRKQLP